MNGRDLPEELPDYRQVLEMHSEKAENGSVSAMVCLERALRPENQPPEEDEVGEGIDQILRKGA